MAQKIRTKPKIRITKSFLKTKKFFIASEPLNQGELDHPLALVMDASILQVN